MRSINEHIWRFLLLLAVLANYDQRRRPTRTVTVRERDAKIERLCEGLLQKRKGDQTNLAQGSGSGNRCADPLLAFSDDRIDILS